MIKEAQHRDVLGAVNPGVVSQLYVVLPHRHCSFIRIQISCRI